MENLMKEGEGEDEKDFDSEKGKEENIGRLIIGKERRKDEDD